jgi:hypothetical protein
VEPLDLIHLNLHLNLRIGGHQTLDAYHHDQAHQILDLQCRHDHQNREPWDHLGPNLVGTSRRVQEDSFQVLVGDFHGLVDDKRHMDLQSQVEFRLELVDGEVVDFQMVNPDFLVKSMGMLGLAAHHPVQVVAKVVLPEVVVLWKSQPPLRFLFDH